MVLPLFLHVQAGPGVGVEKCTVSCHEWKADTNVKLDRKTDDACINTFGRVGRSFAKKSHDQFWFATFFRSRCGAS